MFKKSLAIMLVGSMLVSAAPVMAAESEAASSVTSVAESVAESTENDAAESTESAAAEETDEVDFRALVETMVAEIEKAVAEVDLEKKEETLGKDFSEDGTVFSILENIMKDIEEKRTAEGKDLGDDVTQILDALANLGETDETALDALLEEGIDGTDSEEAADDAEEDPMAESIIANLVAGFVFEAARENEQIAEAVEATGSNLFEILMGDETEEEADADLLDLVAEEPFEDFETELAKVTDYINEQEGPKQASLDLLNLVHEIVDEIHQSLHGHTHKKLASIK